MEFPHVDENTQEKYAQLWPVVAENVSVKEAAKDAPKMLSAPTKAEKEAAGGFHYKLYEDRIPAGVDADKSFGKWATEEARTKALEESANYTRGNAITKEQGESAALTRAPMEVRYYPAVNPEVENPEEKNRDAFNKIVAGVVAERDAAAKASNPESKVERKDVVMYDKSEHVKAFVSKIGPIPELAYFQSDEAKQAWKEEGAKLEKGEQKAVGRAKDIVDRASDVAAGNDFVGKYGKGLLMPPKDKTAERAAVTAEISGASMDDLKTVQTASQTAFKALERKLYGIQVNAAKEKGVAVEDFNKLNASERRKAAGYKELSDEEFRTMTRMKDGYFTIGRELNGRGEHLTKDQAQDIKNQPEAKEQKKPLDEKSKSLKPAAEPQKSGRASSRGAAAAAALAGNMGRS
jgi:hypothetical protein